MLNSLSVKNFALIDELEIDFKPGLSIITGETGAGKSILLGALALLLGQRADTSVIKNENLKCIVEANFNIKNYNLLQTFSELEIDYFEETIIRREINRAGKSRAFINDTPVNLNQLKEITSKLIDIHSQHETLKLNETKFQLEIIDIYANNKALNDEYLNTFVNYKNLLKQLEQLKNEAEKSKLQQELVQTKYQELEDAKLKEDEQEDLEKEQDTLTHVEEIKLNLAKIYNAMSGEENPIILQLKTCVEAARNINKYLHKAEEFFNRLQTAYIDLEDLSTEVEIQNNNIEFNPLRLEFINQRIDIIYALQKKHKVNSCAELLEIKNQLNDKLKAISSFDENIEILEKKITAELITLKELANKLHEQRKKFAPKFEKEILEILKQLGMINATFNVKITKNQDFSETGTDEINFLFSANKNVDLQKIEKVASGGELSRLMLAIKAIISNSKALPTIIFDEIDTGVSGEIADKMGNILKKMSRKLQVLNITHLPQVAAKGDAHYKVYKIEQQNTTSSKIKLLSDQERLQEVAKMLSGENITQAAIENAKVLFNNNFINN